MMAKESPTMAHRSQPEAYSNWDWVLNQGQTQAMAHPSIPASSLLLRLAFKSRASTAHGWSILHIWACFGPSLWLRLGLNLRPKAAQYVAKSVQYLYHVQMGKYLVGSLAFSMQTKMPCTCWELQTQIPCSCCSAFPRFSPILGCETRTLNCPMCCNSCTNLR